MKAFFKKYLLKYAKSILMELLGEMIADLLKEFERRGGKMPKQYLFGYPQDSMGSLTSEMAVRDIAKLLRGENIPARSKLSLAALLQDLVYTDLK